MSVRDTKGHFFPLKTIDFSNPYVYSIFTKRINHWGQRPKERHSFALELPLSMNHVWSIWHKMPFDCFFLFSDIQVFRASKSNWLITRWVFVFKSKQNKVNQVNTKSFYNTYIDTLRQTNDPPSTQFVSLLFMKNISNFWQNRMTRSFYRSECLN